MLQQEYELFQRPMLELFEDQDSIPFAKGNDVHLGLLKKEIDRRFIKIKKMLNFYNIREIIAVSTYDQACQTQILQQQVTLRMPLESSPQFLSPSRLNIIKQKESSTERVKVNSPKKGQNGCKNKKPQLPFQFKQNYERDHVQQLLMAKNKRQQNHCIPQLQNDSEDSESSDSQIQKGNNQKTKSKNELFGSIEFKFKDALIISDKRSRRTEGAKYPTIKEAKSLDHSLSISEYSEQSVKHQRYSYSTTKRKFSAEKKLKIASQTIPSEQEKRIIVTEECKQQILDTIQKMIPKRRREADSKLRSNLINRIDQKYGDYYNKI